MDATGWKGGPAGLGEPALGCDVVADEAPGADAVEPGADALAVVEGLRAVDDEVGAADAPGAVVASPGGSDPGVPARLRGGRPSDAASSPPPTAHDVMSSTTASAAPRVVLRGPRIVRQW
jgi:hypothetical protein